MRTELLLTLLMICTWSYGQEHHDETSIGVSADGFKMIHILNHRGAVSVTASDDSQCTVHVQRTLRCASETKLARAVKDVYLDTITYDGNLYFFIEDPDRIFQIGPEGDAEYSSREWEFDSNEDRFRVEKRFDLTVSVPAQIDLEVVNHEHPLDVVGMQGKVVARNHHDGIKIDGAMSDVVARTHHGDISISFDRNPSRQVLAATHHGDIALEMQAQLSAEVNLESRHGSFYTDFDWTSLPMQVEKNEDNKGTKYSIGKGRGIRIGNQPNEIKMKLKTYHGDIIISGRKNN